MWNAASITALLIALGGVIGGVAALVGQIMHNNDPHAHSGGTHVGAADAQPGRRPDDTGGQQPPAAV